MRLTWRDAVATALVATAVGVYASHLVGAPMGAGFGPRWVAAMILALSIGAGSIGVRDPRTMAANWWRDRRVSVFVLLGSVVVVAALVTLIAGSETMLAVMVAAVVLIWLIATVRHIRRPRTTTADAEEDREYEVALQRLLGRQRQEATRR